VAERVLRYAHAPVLIARAATRTGNVLVATDLSDPSLPAIAAAAREATRAGVRVTALHCVEPISVVAMPADGLGWSPVVLPSVLDEACRVASKKLAQASAPFGLAGDRRVVVGSPSVAIVTAAEEIGADLIIVGTRGKTGLKRVLLGSVAEAVVRLAGCSVLVVRLRDHEPVVSAQVST
jgi:nucleotide-binding universal stress UspA family protein